MSAAIIDESLHCNKTITLKDNKDFGPPTAFLYHTVGDTCATDVVNVTDVRPVLVIAILRHS